MTLIGRRSTIRWCRSTSSGPLLEIPWETNVLAPPNLKGVAHSGIIRADIFGGRYGPTHRLVVPRPGDRDGRTRARAPLVCGLRPYTDAHAERYGHQVPVDE